MLSATRRPSCSLTDHQSLQTGDEIHIHTHTCINFTFESVKHVYWSQVKSKIFYYNTRKMYIDESIRLKPIQAYLSFISIMSLYNNDLHLVEQVSKSAGTQRTRHTMKENHCYVKNSVLPPSRRSNEIAPAQRVFWEKMVCHYIITCILQRMNKVYISLSQVQWSYITENVEPYNIVLWL